jgi:poly [ADP-ribose] polymerase 1
MHITKDSNVEWNLLSKKISEYKPLFECVKNTHADTHSTYKLNVKEILKLNRKGEVDRYEAFKSLHNRKLLWHGSRLTNFAGILSQGLRIAPPEAPSAGFMFGKGKIIIINNCLILCIIISNFCIDL